MSATVVLALLLGAAVEYIAVDLYHHARTSPKKKGKHK